MFTLIILLWLVFLACYLIAVVRTWRSSALWAVLMLLLLPAGVYVLIKHWSEQGGPSRPLLAAFAAFALAFGLGHRLAPQIAIDQLEGEVDSQTVTGPESEDEVSRSARRARALSTLSRQVGAVTIAETPIAIDVPTHFQFIDRAALMQAFQGTIDEPDETTVGWFVHERVDLTNRRAWHVEVDYLGDGYVPSSGFASVSADALRARVQSGLDQMAQLEGDDPTLISGYAELPTYDPRTARATWVQTMVPHGRGAPELDCHAVQLGRKGVVLLSITAIAPSRQELCLRSVRMLAAHTQFGRGQEYADYSRMLDRKAPYDLAGLITGSLAETP